MRDTRGHLCTDGMEARQEGDAGSTCRTRRWGAGGCALSLQRVDFVQEWTPPHPQALQVHRRAGGTLPASLWAAVSWSSWR